MSSFDLDALERRILASDSNGRTVLGLIAELRTCGAEKKVLWENLHGEQAESRRRIAQLERVAEAAAFFNSTDNVLWSRQSNIEGLTRLRAALDALESEK